MLAKQAQYLIMAFSQHRNGHLRRDAQALRKILRLVWVARTDLMEPKRERREPL